MLLRNKSSKSSNLSDFPSKVGSDAVRAFGSVEWWSQSCLSQIVFWPPLDVLWPLVDSRPYFWSFRVICGVG